MPQTPAPGPAGSSDSTALVLFSGGQDSATCLAWALERFARVETVGFDYGQRHVVEMQARLEVRAAIAAGFPEWAARLGDDHVLDIASFGKVAESALTADREIEATERGLPSTFVPGRNLVFFVYAAALADRRGADVLVGGMCETDYSGYPDCRRDAIDAQEQALRLGMARPFRIETPLMRLTKAQTWGLAHELGGDRLVEIVRTETHTCYRGDRTMHAWGAGCGTCPACELRAKGWAEWTDEAPSGSRFARATSPAPQGRSDDEAPAFFRAPPLAGELSATDGSPATTEGASPASTGTLRL